MIKAVQIIVSGRVQGVGFRWATKRVAEEMNVTGYVTNLTDGHVKIVAQAETPNLKRFISAIKASPTPYGYVSNVDLTPVSRRHYQFFNVK